MNREHSPRCSRKRTCLHGGWTSSTELGLLPRLSVQVYRVVHAVEFLLVYSLAVAVVSLRTRLWSKTMERAPTVDAIGGSNDITIPSLDRLLGRLKIECTPSLTR